MREGLDTYGEHIRYSPLYDYVWEVIDSDKRGMVTMNDFKAGLKVVLGVTPSEKTHRPRTPTEQSQENSRRCVWQLRARSPARGLRRLVARTP
jgi:hypothetical protein